VEVLDVEGINLGARDLETRESQRKIRKIDLGMNIGSGSGTHHGQEKSTQCSESDLKILSGNMRSGSGLGPCKKKRAIWRGAQHRRNHGERYPNKSRSGLNKTRGDQQKNQWKMNAILAS
jgi:hypothetical protein